MGNSKFGYFLHFIDLWTTVCPAWLESLLFHVCQCEDMYDDPLIIPSRDYVALILSLTFLLFEALIRSLTLLLPSLVIRWFRQKTVKFLSFCQFCLYPAYGIPIYPNQSQRPSRALYRRARTSPTCAPHSDTKPKNTSFRPKMGICCVSTVYVARRENRTRSWDQTCDVKLNTNPSYICTTGY